MSRPSIILVDDDQAVRSSVEFALEAEGFDVSTFASAECLLAARIAGGCDCLILDYRLPGLDGLALLGRLRAQGIGAPAIIMTSNPSHRLGSQVAQAGALLLEKPLLGDSLAQAVRSVAGAAAGRAGASPGELTPGTA
jgi:FixJ family two-component response regulator